MRLTIQSTKPSTFVPPGHWCSFDRRISPLTAGPRLATNPTNAILYYLYAILEAEVRIALLTVGLDPALGIVHAGYQGRDPLALGASEGWRLRP